LIGDEDECPHNKDHVDNVDAVPLEDLKSSTPKNDSEIISTNV
jgi:hypothetical protein